MITHFEEISIETLLTGKHAKSKVVIAHRVGGDPGCNFLDVTNTTNTFNRKRCFCDQKLLNQCVRGRRLHDATNIMLHVPNRHDCMGGFQV